LSFAAASFPIRPLIYNLKKADDEMMLPAALDPWASYALFEAATRVGQASRLSQT